MKFFINAIVLLSIIILINSRKLKKKFRSKLIDNLLPNEEDNLSYSQKNGAIQTKLDFDLYIDIKNQIISGKVKVNYKCIEEADNIGLDIRDLIINEIYDNDKNKLSYIIVKNNKNTIGDGLIVQFTKKCNSEEESFIEINYSTKRDSIGIHFSDKSVIHEKKYGYMYTHGEAIYSRSVFPSQDTPLYKITTTAKIKIKSPYVVLFSGKFTKKEKIDEDNVYSFEMDKPIPTYLITIAAGIFKKQDISERCQVWGERNSLKWAPESFKLCDKYINYYEKIKPFAFDKMIFLIMPNDFPFSGTENPYVTYISEDMLSADGSYSSVIAHEIAHFWSGNLVTNKSWRCFWLNEGITTYLTRKVTKYLYGEEEYNFQLNEGYLKLNNTLEEFKTQFENQTSLRSLNQEITDDPYISFSKIPYEKGSLFMYYLEKLVGEEKMYGYLSEYFEKFSFKTVDNDDFIEFFSEKIENVDWEAWINGTDNIPEDLNIKSTKTDEIETMAKNLTLDIDFDEIKDKVSELKSFEKEILLKVIFDDYEKIKDWNKIHKLIRDDELFKNENIRVIAMIKLLDIVSTENLNKRKDLIEKTFKDFKFYKIFFIRHLFKLLYSTTKDKEEVNKLLDKYTSRLNPITVVRMKEFINKFK